MKTLSPLRLLAYAVSVLSCIPMTMAQYDYINTKLCFWDVQRTGELHYADPSPEATAMRRYQDYPVSHATGTADISIPLVELPAGGATVSLGLSYHTGAIKRDEESTDVGLGWSLTGLGIISRRINGYPDEWTGRSEIGGFHDPRPISFRLDPYSQDWKYMLGIMEGWYDTDYDLFSYSIPGYSGHFIIQNDTTWYGATMSVRSEIKQLPPTDLHIDFSSQKKDGLLKYIFHITTPNGIRYEFNQADIVSRTTTMSSVRLSYADPDYEAEAVWHPTFITDNKRRGDTLRITYRDGGNWTRGGNYTSTAQGYMIYCDQYDNSYRTKYSSYDNIVKIENTVSAYTRMIPARISGKSGSIGFSSSGKASVITLKNAEGDVIKTVTLDNYSSHGDGRRRLDGVTIRSGNQIIDSYRFTYNNSVNAPGSDIFGYSNGNGYRYGSILDLDLKWEGRRPDPSCVSSASLKTVTDIAGVTTTLEYEPVNYDVGYGSLFGSYVCIGHRLRSIRAECPVTGRHRTRSFIYDRPRCNISLGVFNYTDFLTQSGFYEKTSLDGTFRYSFGVTHTTSPTTRGVSLENAVVYYGKVTEWVSGSGLEHPVHTVYEYDTDPMINTFHQSYRTGSCIRSNAIRKDKFLPLYSHYYSNQMQGFDSRPLEFVYSAGYFQERTGAAPLLKCRTDYEYINGIYSPRIEQRIAYMETDKEELYVGGHCESTVLVKYDEFVNSEFGIDCTGDMNYYFTKLYSSRFVRESAETTTYFPDGNSRTIKTRYLNRGNQISCCPGFEYDTTRVTPATVSQRPMGISISCDDESLTMMTLSSWMSTDMILRDAAYDRFTRTKPEVEKLVYRTAEGADSVHRRYGYRYGRSFQIYLDCVSLEAGTYIHEDTAVISRRYYTDYDNDYRPTSMIDEQGRRVDMTWLELYDNMTSRTYRDVGLTSSYTYKPMVGCTGVTHPSGYARKYGYKAGRLTKIMNTYGETMQEYSYRLYNDGCDELKHNSIRQKTYNTTKKKPFTNTGPMRTSVAIWPTDTTTVGEDIENSVWEEDDGYEEECKDCDIETCSCQTVYYDGFGLPVQTVTPVAGGSLVRTASEYDALDRPVRQYLPVPAADDSFLALFQPDISDYYGDNYPYSMVTYRMMRGDTPLQVMKEGEAMQGHPERYEYLCNSVTDQKLRCRRYRLSDSRDSESVTLDGYYPAGALDVTRVTDPDGCSLLTFTDWRGFRILERRPVDNDTYADTYYLYDIRGNVRVILQPEASALMTRDGTTWTGSDEVLDRLAFINRYDRRGNCIYAKVPGGGDVRMRYDPLNRLAFRQTAVMRERDVCELNLYDMAGRAVISGIYDDDIPAYDEIPLMTVGYDIGSDNSFEDTGYILPDGINQELLCAAHVCYYDSYSCLGLQHFADVSFDGILINNTTVKGNMSMERISPDRNWAETCDCDHYRDKYIIYNYDIEGNVTAKYHYSGNRYLTETASYTRQGALQSKEVILSDTLNRYRYTITYDQAGFMHGEEVCSPRIDNTGNRTAVSYGYNDIGMLTEKTVDGRHVTNYTYNLRGQLLTIDTDVFSETVKYEESGSPYYNGNISEMIRSYGKSTTVTQYPEYDQLNRLIRCKTTDGYNTSFSYNLNSSPVSIVRNGMASDGTIGPVDDITMEYDGNRLIKASDLTDPVLLENSCDFAAEESVYVYDSDGKLISDTGRGIANIEYSVNNKPLRITNESGNRIISYEYYSDGTRKSRTTVSYQYSNPISRKTSYYDAFELSVKDKIKRSIFNRLNIPWGYVSEFGRVYTYVHDYQGNVRAVVDSAGTAVQMTDYYPYGLPTARSTGAASNRYKYSGKEFEAIGGLNRYDFHARQYDPALGLFDRPDPMAINYPGLNPYLYCAANPVMNVDPTGKDTWRINEKGEVVEWIDAKEYDRFEFIDDDGNIRRNSDGEEQSLQFKYGTVKHTCERYSNIRSDNNGNMSGEYDLFAVNGDRNGTDLFEMFAKNVTALSGNEIGLIRTGTLGKGTNYITSAHRFLSEPGGPDLFHNRLKNGYFVREITHSHQSVAKASKNDQISHLQILDNYHFSNTIRFKIYVSTLDYYIQYDPLNY